jgi:predicted DCC family thiol-disulfide oxidoreductase YuxK
MTKSLFRRLHDHWFEPAPLTDVALVRVVLVAMELLLLLVPTLALGAGACKGCNPDYQRWLTTAQPATYHPLLALKVLLLPFGWGARPDPALLHAVWLLAVASGIAGLIGLYTRASLLVFAATTTLLTAHSYSYGEFHHPEAALTIALWVLAMSPAGKRYSLDDLRSRMRRAAGRMRFEPEGGAKLSPHARWPLRLVQWVLVLVYLSGAYSKLRYGGLQWFNGYTLAYYVGADALHGGSGLGLWLAQHVRLLQLLSIGAVAIELGFGAILVWPALAWVLVLSAAGLHTGIYLLQRAPFPQFLALYSVFVGALRTAWPMPQRCRARVPSAIPRWTVIYDGRCPLCVRSMTVLDFLDLRRALNYVDLERSEDPGVRAAPAGTPTTRHAIHVVGPDGTVYRGYFAVRALARALPPLRLVVPFLLLPFADRVGAAIFDLVARRRTRDVVCRA